MATILIAEDDADMRLLIYEHLKKDYDIIQAEDGVRAFDALMENHVDLIVADIMMPNMDGFDLARKIRENGMDIPIIMVTAKHALDDKRNGFFVGADDYMTKPIQFEELKWRIEALLRRARIAADQKIEIGAFSLNATTCECRYENVSIELTRKEFQLIYRLLSYPNRLFSKEKLMEEIWGYDSVSDDTTVRTHINRLRNKLEKVKEFEIFTFRGLGYKVVTKENK